MKNKLKTEVQRVSVEKLTPYINNAKEHPDEQIKKIASSIKNYGYDQPIVVDEDYEIIKGHGRLEAAKHLGLEKVPVIVRNDLTDAEKKASRLADNRTAESGWDEEALQSELEELDEQGFDTELTGFGEDELDDYMLDDEPEAEEDGVNAEERAEDIEDPETEKGEIIVLGDHRLMCGDSFDPEDRAQLIDGKEIGTVFTDPPYGIEVVNSDTGTIGGGGATDPGEYKEVEGDDKEFDPSPFNAMADRLIYFGANNFASRLPEDSSHWLVWDKRGGREELDNDSFGEAELIYTNITDRKSVKMYRQLWKGMIREDESGERVHPTQKPIKLCGEILNDYTTEGERVIDPFAGSGPTLLAAEETNRKCLAMEYDPVYCDIIVERWEDFTNKSAKRIKPDSQGED